MQVKIDARGLKVGQQRHELLQRASQSIHRPCHHHIDLAPGDGVVGPVLTRPPVASPGATDTLVNVLGDDMPIHALGNGPQLLELVVRRLFAGRDARVNGHLLRHRSEHRRKTVDRVRRNARFPRKSGTGPSGTESLRFHPHCRDTPSRRPVRARLRFLCGLVANVIMLHSVHDTKETRAREMTLAAAWITRRVKIGASTSR